MAKKTRSRGLGDTVEKITKATGIKWLVGECEDCDKRKELLNKLLRYKPVKGCINEDEYNNLKNIIKKERLTLSEQIYVGAITNKVWGYTVQFSASCPPWVWGYTVKFSTSCPPCNASIIQELNILIEVYEK